MLFYISQDVFLNFVSLLRKERRTTMDALTQKPEIVEEYERVFERYLEVCNQAIEKNKTKYLSLIGPVMVVALC